MAPLKDITKQKISRPKTSKNKEDVQPVNPDLDSLFSGDVGGDSDTKIVKELITGSDIEQKTELTATQISIISRLYFYEEMVELPELKTLLDKFLTLQISKDRKSRREFVESLRGVMEQKNGGGFIEKFQGMFKSG